MAVWANRPHQQHVLEQRPLVSCRAYRQHLRVHYLRPPWLPPRPPPHRPRGCPAGARSVARWTHKLRSSSTFGSSVGAPQAHHHPVLEPATLFVCSCATLVFEPAKEAAAFRVYKGADAAAANGDNGDQPAAPSWDAGVYEHYKQMRMYQVRCDGQRRRHGVRVRLCDWGPQNARSPRSLQPGPSLTRAQPADGRVCRPHGGQGVQLQPRPHDGVGGVQQAQGASAASVTSAGRRKRPVTAARWQHVDSHDEPPRPFPSPPTLLLPRAGLCGPVGPGHHAAQPGAHAADGGARARRGQAGLVPAGLPHPRHRQGTWTCERRGGVGTARAWTSGRSKRVRRSLGARARGSPRFLTHLQPHAYPLTVFSRSQMMFLWGGPEDGMSGRADGPQYALGGDTWVL